MMRRSAAFLAGMLASAALVLCGMAWAVDGGGVPYFLRLGSLGVGTAAPTTVGVAKIGTALQVVSPDNEVLTQQSTQGAGNAAEIYQAWRDSAFARLGYVGKGDKTDGNITLESDTGGVILQAESHTAVLSSAGVLTVDSNPVCLQDGKDCGLTAANIGGTSGCTIATGSINAASCSRLGTGDYTLTFSVAYSKTPTCVASTVQLVPGNTPVVAEISAVTPSAVTVLLMNSTTTGTFEDDTAYVICH